MPLRESIYEAALRCARPVAGAASPLHPKLARGVRGRRTAAAELTTWAEAGRRPGAPLVWLHAPSVGEGLMAQAIAGALKARRPELQILFTFFSPSAERLAGRVGADVHGYLPWDLRSELRPPLRRLRPAVVGFVRTEVWPVLSREAARAGARLALVNAVLGPGSGRLGRASRFLLGPAFRRLDRVGAVAEADAGHFERLGVPRERVRVTGDARFDQVWERVASLREGRTRPETASLLDRLRDPQTATLVAGSTWPADEERLVPAFADLLRAGRVVRLIIAPHEPDERHLSALEARLDRAGLAHARLAAVEAGRSPPEVVVVDRVGVLADLYAIGDAAYVGGGFHSAGLHSVIEPAALGVPVVFGPRHGNAREAAELAAAGGGFQVSGTEALLESCAALLGPPDARRAPGQAAERYVRSRLGGAARNAELILELLG